MPISIKSKRASHILSLVLLTVGWIGFTMLALALAGVFDQPGRITSDPGAIANHGKSVDDSVMASAVGSLNTNFSASDSVAPDAKNPDCPTATPPNLSGDPPTYYSWVCQAAEAQESNDTSSATGT